jgi:hypothetical protein
MCENLVTLFDCHLCECPVVLRGGPGRLYEFRSGMFLEIPGDFPTAVCSHCGENYLTTDDVNKLEELFSEMIFTKTNSLAKQD